MRIPGVKSAKHFSRWVGARVLGGALVLGYHRVADVKRDEYEVCVAPNFFAEQMEALRKYAHPIHLADLVHCLQAGALPPRSVAVTFDDGYADNLYEAKPVLEKYEIPATIFVCSGYQGKEFWWDELQRLVVSSQTELGALRLEVGKGQFVWNQPEVSPAADLDVRGKFHRSLYNFLLDLDFEEQSQAMNTIRSWSGIASDQTTARAMTHEELLQLADGGLIEIGSHTRHHPVLPRLLLERQREEITLGKEDLENLLGKRVDGFAYPNGKATDDAKQIVRDVGFAFACTSLQDVVRPGGDIFELTRFWQGNVDGEKFLQRMLTWMKGA